MGKERKNKIDFTIDVNKLSEDDAFPCPKCGVIISPDDETKEIYDDPEPLMRGTELEAVLLRCKKCGSTIKLVGFLELLQ